MFVSHTVWKTRSEEFWRSILPRGTQGRRDITIQSPNIKNKNTTLIKSLFTFILGGLQPQNSYVLKTIWGRCDRRVMSSNPFSPGNHWSPKCKISAKLFLARNAFIQSLHKRFNCKNVLHSWKYKNLTLTWIFPVTATTNYFSFQLNLYIFILVVESFISPNLWHNFLPQLILFPKTPKKRKQICLQHKTHNPQGENIFHEKMQKNVKKRNSTHKISMNYPLTN